MSAEKWTRKGSPLAVEATPVATPPADGATIGPVPRPPAGNETLWLALLDGTSISVQLWAEVAPGVWVSVGAPIALAVHAASVGIVVPSGVRLFPQVTAAAGAPTTLAAGTVSA